jgi:hypothetical protein
MLRELLYELARNPRLKMVTDRADNVRPGDLLQQEDRLDRVVRVYPRGQSGESSSCEISFGSVCVSMLRGEPVTVYRDPSREYCHPFSRAALWVSKAQGWMHL